MKKYQRGFLFIMRNNEILPMRRGKCRFKLIDRKINKMLEEGQGLYSSYYSSYYSSMETNLNVT